MDGTRLVLDQYSIGMKSIGGGAGQLDGTRAGVEAIGEMIVGLVADGAGSSDTGADAAQRVLDTIINHLKQNTDMGIPEKIAEAINAAHPFVNQLRSFGLAVIWNDRLYVGNIGGSRVYLVSEPGTLVLLGQNYPGHSLSGEDLKASPDQKQAFWMGTAELPLKPGETVLLCSDGLVKKGRAGWEYVREQELIDSVQSDVASGAARKIVRYAQGRQVDEAVAVVVMQHLTVERILQMEAAQRMAQRQAFVQRRALLTGMGVLALAWIFVMTLLFGTQKEASGLGEGPELSKNGVGASQSLQSPAQPVVPGKLNVNGDDGPIFGAVSGPGGTVDQVIYTGTTLTTQETGQRVVIGVPKGSLSIVYLFANTQAQINFADQVLVMLYQGYVYVQPGVGPVEVHLPQFQDAVARVQGSRMIVRVLNSSEVEVLCFEGKCDFRYPGRSELVSISVGSKRTFNMVNGVAGTEVPMSYAEIGEMNVACGNCVTAALPTSVPLPPPPVFTPTIVVAQVPPKSIINGGIPNSVPVHTATLTPSEVPPTLTYTPLPTGTSTPIPATFTPTPVPPTITPTEVLPTLIPTPVATNTPTPTSIPTSTETPTPVPPTAAPTQISPTPEPPKGKPTKVPKPSPTVATIIVSTIDPTMIPTPVPTLEPTLAPTAVPTVELTLAPTAAPTPEPTLAPTAVPTAEPTAAPTAAPTPEPTLAPTAVPTAEPTAAPTAAPTLAPTSAPTAEPTLAPTTAPTPEPTLAPTPGPTAAPAP